MKSRHSVFPRSVAIVNNSNSFKTECSIGQNLRGIDIKDSKSHNSRGFGNINGWMIEKAFNINLAINFAIVDFRLANSSPIVVSYFMIVNTDLRLDYRLPNLIG